MNSKRGEFLTRTVVHIILIGLIFALFFIAINGRENSKDVRHQVVEKQTALLIDSAVPGMSFEIPRENLNGNVSLVEVRAGRVFVVVDGFVSLEGYPYFSKYFVEVVEGGGKDKFVVRVS